MFWLLSVYITVFIVINVKWGVIATPVSQFGMYGGKFAVADTLEIYHVYTDTAVIDFAKLSLVERDVLQLSIHSYLVEKQSNAAVFTTMKRVMSKFGVGLLMKEKRYINNVSPAQFTNWYKGQLSLAGFKNVSLVTAYLQQYLWNGNKLVPVSEPVKLNCFDAGQ